MITVIVTFNLPARVTREEARAIALSTAPKYQGVPGLIRKYYVVSQDGGSAGGIYLWNNKSDADAMYTDNWKKFVTEKYGCAPSVSYMDCTVVVDNLSKEILSDV